MTIRSIARRLGPLSVLFACGLAFAAAAATHHPPAKSESKAVPAADSIILRGDHSTMRVYEALVKAFEKAGDGRVTVQPFSTISGLDAVHAGTADIAASARAAMPGRAEEQGTHFHPVAWDALVPIVSPSNPISNITLKQLHDVYLGRITNWKDLGGNDAPINLDGVAGPLDGVEYSTRLLLFHYGDQNVSVSRMYVNTEKLEEDIALNANGLGMSTLSGVARNPKVKMLSVEGVHASTASIADGTYPLYSAIYLASRDDDPHQDEVAKFVAFAASDAGKALLRQQDLVPYADAPGLPARQDERMAFIDALVRPPQATAVAAANSETPVSAPRATAQALQRIAPTSELTAEAVDRAARAAAAKQQKQADPPEETGH
ncbi:MAG: substrate-binding domain-containing protein [Xanthomonadaceae bacterium]|nr:substrate-binding domain-containing protein [Xanthomonadaceae bacterium]MDE1885089.1 substrate-binding domain-containing protein [Xanthomonadaceae bacterium]MDE1961320.1 substrate-binding domain-containing protein [Xanthomonadaceae bacterium]MDE2083455.1 substrate-binding domain-containing protein [Xanthomonadaceae bacterium]MDE2257331.1 substrate-binding domain-containing protein [Xanthomonadaceae bacterium]